MEVSVIPTPVFEGTFLAFWPSLLSSKLNHVCRVCFLFEGLLTPFSFLCCRYYFKKASDEFECGAVFEEVSDDGSLLPTYEGKILGKVERME